MERAGCGVSYEKQHTVYPLFISSAPGSQARIFFFSRSPQRWEGLHPLPPAHQGLRQLAADEYQEQLNEPHRHLLIQEAQYVVSHNHAPLIAARLLYYNVTQKASFFCKNMQLFLQKPPLTPLTTPPYMWYPSRVIMIATPRITTPQAHRWSR